MRRGGAVTTVTQQLRRMQRRHRRDMAALRRELAALRRVEDGAAVQHDMGTGRLHAAPGVVACQARQAEPEGDNVDLRAFSTDGYGLYAASEHGTGIHCRSFGAGDGLSALSEHGIGIAAMSLGEADGMYAQSARGNGIHAVGGGALGNGHSPQPAGIFAEGGAGHAVHAEATTGNGVVATSASGCAVDARTAEGTGLRARSASVIGLAVEIEGRIRVRGCALGTACVPVGMNTVTVLSAAATAESLIVLVPLDDPRDVLPIWVSARDAGRFSISTGAAAPAAIRVQYLIIN